MGRKIEVEGSNLAAHRGLKRCCFENENCWCLVFLKSVHLFRQYLAGELIYEKLDFVGSYNLKSCTLLLLYFYRLVVLKIKDGYYVNFVVVVL